MNPIIPMLSLTGHPTTEQIYHMFGEFKRAGIEQVMLYPRAGSEYEYMSDEWHRIVLDCITFAKQEQMRIWLYDEFNYPSGSCAGQVGRVDPAYRGKRLVNCGDHVEIEYVDPDVEKFAVDLLSPAAVDCFIAMTHERYAEWFSPYFGNVIAGIFTDEVSCEYYAKNTRPVYYEGAFEDYFAAYASDAREDFLSGSREFYSRWYDLLGKRLRRVYFERVSEWCRNHGLKLTGHIIYDGLINRAIRYAGDPLSTLCALDVPGVDEIHNLFHRRHNDFLFAHIAALRAMGKQDAMAEIYAYGPASLPYIRMKQMLWFAASYGVNHFFTAITHLDLRGNRIKNYFFHDLSPACADWEIGAPELARSAAEAVVYANKTPLCEVCVRWPYTAALAEIKYDRECPAAERMQELIEALVAAQIPWSLVPEGADVGGAICLSVTKKGFIEEQSARKYTKIADAVADIVPRVRRPVLLTTAAGELASDVTVRSYTDGSFVIIDKRCDAADKTRELILHRDGRETPVLLPVSGVLTDKDVSMFPEGATARLEDMSLTSDVPNVLRADFYLSEKFTFTLTEPMEVQLERRIDRDARSVMLDGKELEFSNVPTDLPFSMKQLYRASEQILLSAGEHTLFTQEAEEAYLPVLLIRGSFEKDGATLHPRDASAMPENIDFYGQITLSFNADLSGMSDTLWLSYDDNRLVSELYVDGERIGARATAPYYYEIPARLRSKQTHFELRFRSGHSPLFGDLSEAHKALDLGGGRPFTFPESLTVKGLRVGEGKII